MFESRAEFSTCHWPVHVADLVMQSQEGHWRLNGLPTFGTQPDDLQSSLVNLLSQLIHSNVTGSTHQYWSANAYTPLTVQSIKRKTNVKHSWWNNKIHGITGFFERKTICVLPIALSGQVVYDSRRGDSLPSPWRTLDQTKRPLQHRLHSIHL